MNFIKKYIFPVFILVAIFAMPLTVFTFGFRDLLECLAVFLITSLFSLFGPFLIVFFDHSLNDFLYDGYFALAILLSVVYVSLDYFLKRDRIKISILAFLAAWIGLGAYIFTFHALMSI